MVIVRPPRMCRFVPRFSQRARGRGSRAAPPAWPDRRARAGRPAPPTAARTRRGRSGSALGCVGGSRSTGKSRSATTVQPASVSRGAHSEPRVGISSRVRVAEHVGDPALEPRSAEAQVVREEEQRLGELRHRDQPARTGGVERVAQHPGRVGHVVQRRRGPGQVQGAEIRPAGVKVGLDRADAGRQSGRGRLGAILRQRDGRDVERDDLRVGKPLRPGRSRRCRCPRRGRAAGSGRRPPPRPAPSQARPTSSRAAPRRPGRAGRCSRPRPRPSAGERADRARGARGSASHEGVCLSCLHRKRDCSKGISSCQ